MRSHVVVVQRHQDRGDSPDHHRPDRHARELGGSHPGLRDQRSSSLEDHLEQRPAPARTACASVPATSASCRSTISILRRPRNQLRPMSQAFPEHQLPPRFLSGHRSVARRCPSSSAQFARQAARPFSYMDELVIRTTDLDLLSRHTAAGISVTPSLHLRPE